jgi:subfamily B ATP-binding cassette protein MsbA
VAQLNASNSTSPRPAAVYRRLLGYALPHWRVFALSVFGMVLFSATDVTFVRLIKPLIDQIFVAHDVAVIRWMPPAILGIFLLRGVAGFTAGYGIAWVGQKVVAALRQEVFEHLLRVPVGHHDRARSADLQTKLTYHAGQVADSASTVLTSVVKDGLSALGLLGLMFYTSWRLTLFTLVIVPPVAWSMSWVNRRFRTVSQRIQNSVGDISHSANEAIAGRRVVKVYGAESFVLAGFTRVNEYLRRQSLKMTAASAGSLSLLEFIAAIGVSLLVFVATLPDMLSLVTAGTFTSFVAAMLSLRQPLSSMTTISQSLQRGIVAGADLFTFLDSPVEADAGLVTIGRARGALRFEGVRFKYPGEEREALAGVTLEIAPGRTVAFVGKSGGGKSTLLSLIPRFYDPTAGRVLLDGVDLREYRLADLRRQIALVDQSVVLFNASIAENIAYGQDQAARERIETAARSASAWEFIDASPQGLERQLGQDGGGLSGGQRQRIAIARAMFKDAPILILDEATSALDAEAERFIQQGLDELKRGRTTLVIAHRLSTVQNADLIVVMEDGMVAEQGTHAELLARGGVYAALFRLQFREAPVEAAA